jgi:hypothetical protein
VTICSGQYQCSKNFADFLTEAAGKACWDLVNKGTWLGVKNRRGKQPDSLR